ncbi:MAG: ABC transporter substrate-binding protein [bacterium]|nr:ABC transporter substrate-binding protein [bacterium]
MNQKKIGIWIVVLLLTGAGAYWLATATPEQGDIKIGALLPLTGSLAGYGEDVQNGILLAQDKLSERFVHFDIVYEDSGGDAKTAASGARKLIDIDNVPAVIAGPGSTANLAVAPLFEGSKTLFFPISNTPKLNSAGEYIFKLLHDVDFEIKPTVDFMYAKGIRRAGVLYDSASDSNTAGAKLFQTEFVKAGGEVVFFEGFDSKTINDFRTQLTTLKSVKPDALYFITVGKSAGVAVRQMRELGLTLPLFGWSGLNDGEFFAGAGAHAEGLTIIDQPFSCLGTAEAREYCALYAARFEGRVPQVFGAVAYDLLFLFVDAFETNGIEGPEIEKEEKEKLVAYFTGKAYKGISGDLRFDADGNIRDKNFVFRVVKDGKFVEIQ